MIQINEVTEEKKNKAKNNSIIYKWRLGLKDVGENYQNLIKNRKAMEKQLQKIEIVKVRYGCCSLTI